MLIYLLYGIVYVFNASFKSLLKENFSISLSIKYLKNNLIHPDFFIHLFTSTVTSPVASLRGGRVWPAPGVTILGVTPFYDTNRPKKKTTVGYVQNHWKCLAR